MRSSKRRHRSKSKLNGLIFGVVAILALAYGFLGPKLYGNLKLRKARLVEARVSVAGDDLTIYNPDSKDWHGLTVTANGDYMTVVSWIPLNSSETVALSQFKSKSQSLGSLKGKAVTNVLITIEGGTNIPVNFTNANPQGFPF